MSNTSFGIDCTDNDFIHETKKYNNSDEMSLKDINTASENRVTRSQSNRPLNSEQNISLYLQGQEEELEATPEYQPSEPQNVGTARHYKISNETKFQIVGQQLGPHNYIAQKVIDQRVSNEEIHQYLVKWKGQKLNLCQWLSDIDPDLIEKYQNEIRSGKTQPGKGAYAFKRALRRDKKTNDPPGFVTSNSNVQKLRITTNGSYPQVITSRFRNMNDINEDKSSDADFDEDGENRCFDLKNSLRKINKKYHSKGRYVDNFYDEFDQAEFYDVNNANGDDNDDDDDYQNSDIENFSKDIGSLSKQHAFVPRKRAKAMANIIRSRPSPFQETQESSSSNNFPFTISTPSRSLMCQNMIPPQSNEQMLKPKPIKRNSEYSTTALTLPRLLPIGQDLCGQRKSNIFKPIIESECLLKKSKSTTDPSITPNICYFPYSPFLQTKVTDPYSCKSSSSFFEISPLACRKQRDEQTSSQNTRDYIKGVREPKFCEGSFARGDKPKSIEKIYINDQNQKVIRVSWQRKAVKNGKQFQPNPTQYLWKVFPEAGLKLVLDYLLDKLMFEGVSDRVSLKNHDQVSTKAQSD